MYPPAGHVGMGGVGCAAGRVLTPLGSITSFLDRVGGWINQAGQVVDAAGNVVTNIQTPAGQRLLLPPPLFQAQSVVSSPLVLGGLVVAAWLLFRRKR